MGRRPKQFTYEPPDRPMRRQPDFRTEIVCLMCTRVPPEQPNEPPPRRCPFCGGALITHEVYEPRYG